MQGMQGHGHLPARKREACVPPLRRQECLCLPQWPTQVQVHRMQGQGYLRARQAQKCLQGLWHRTTSCFYEPGCCGCSLSGWAAGPCRCSATASGCFMIVQYSASSAECFFSHIYHCRRRRSITMAAIHVCTSKWTQIISRFHNRKTRPHIETKTTRKKNVCTTIPSTFIHLFLHAQPQANLSLPARRLATAAWPLTREPYRPRSAGTESTRRGNCNSSGNRGKQMRTATCATHCSILSK